MVARAVKLSLLLVASLLAACGGHSSETVREQVAPGGSTTGGADARAGAGSGTSAAGATSGGSAAGGAAGESQGGSVLTGSAGEPDVEGGAAPVGNGGEGGLEECRSALDCPTPPSRCSYAACQHGACVVRSAADGAFAVRNEPPDCYARVCDGDGNEREIVDVDNAPAPSGACTRSFCTADGLPQSAAVAAGAACAENGGKWCDGASKCVACLADYDCDPGASCVQHACVSEECSDGFKDGDETDIDCGGSCTACALTRDCKKDADCASGSCDALPPHRCLADHCRDNHKSADETDSDCGGSCVDCGDGHGCKADSDCESGVCKLDRGGLCYSKTCMNGVQDSGETDLDCGGGQCDGCGFGQTCYLNYDCLSIVCDADTLKCATDHCADHHWDADETDKDCGGTDCTRCALGKRCKVDSDCAAGTTCYGFIPRVCL